MEEEEVNEHVDISGDDLELDQQSGGVAEREVPSSQLENVDLGEDISSELPGSSVIRVDDDHFEQVSLGDQDKIDGERCEFERPEASLSSVNVTGLSKSTEVTSDLSSGSLVDKMDSSRGGELSMGRVDSGDGDTRNPSSSTSMDIYPESGWSPVESPQKYRPKPTMPSVSPELLHLIDSAIMRKPESLDKLKNIVNGVEIFGGEEDSESMAFSVVDSLLATMGGVECFEEDDDDNPPSVMLNAWAAIVAGELIPWLPCASDRMGSMSPRTRMVRGLLAILRACTRNRAMCSIAGLLGVLLTSAERICTQRAGSMELMEWDGTPLCSCIQYLAGHSLSVTDLRRWFEVISKTLTTKWAFRLMLSLEKAVGGKETIGPASTFEFDGESSGLLGPGDTRWPFSNGYAFVTWIYMEAFEDPLNTATTAAAIAAAAAAGKASPMSAAAAASALAGEGTAQMPRLFSFLAADNQGLEAYFHGQFLVVECCSGKGKKVSLHFTHPFKPQSWYFIGIEHTCRQGLLGKAERELRLYIDGSLYESRPFEFPRISKPLQFCCIGTNPPPAMAGLQRRRRQCPLFAEMGPVYIFKEPIGPEKMSRLASRGGDVLPSFGTGVGLPWLATSVYVQNLAEESLLLDAELAGSVYLLYHPRLLSGRYCPDASPSGLAGPLRRPAEVLGQVHVASRQRPVEALWALAYGGPMSLLPLTVTSVKKDSLDPEPGNPALCLAATALAAPIFRIIAMAMQHPVNNEEIRRVRGPELLSKILTYLLQSLCSVDARNHDGVGDEELVASVVSLCQAQKHNHVLKVQLFSNLLMDLKLWSLCNYGLQKKLLSSLADMVFTESSVMRDASAIQMLLDGCRRCYWTVREKDSVNTFSLKKGKTRPIGEVNALIDELLVIIELLTVAAPSSLAADDMRCLLSFMLDCPQPNQVARVLHLIYRLVVQPKASRAQTFAEAFLSCGGIETLLVLLQREAMSGDQDFCNPSVADDEKDMSIDSSAVAHESGVSKSSDADNFESLEEKKMTSQGEGLDVELLSSQNRVDPDLINVNGDLGDISTEIPLERTSVSESLFVKNVGGINLSISAHNARNNVYNFDQSDGTVVGIIKLLGTLVTSGYLKFNLNNHPSLDATVSSGLPDSGGSMFDDKVSLLLFSLQKAFQAAPQRLMTSNVYTALLAASINATSTDDGLNLYDFGHRFEHLQLLLVLLRSLPHASALLQNQVLQDLLFLACSHPENRSCLTKMEEWPEWILEVLISNYEKGALDSLNSSSFVDVEDLIHSFLIIMLEHSMRQKDGWKDIEATIHCAEWLCMVGGSSTGDQRVRREESLPIFKRRLLGSLLDFSARELQVQTEVIAAAAAGVAAEFSSATNAKAETENATQLSVALVENSIVLLMLVEDHLRLQSKIYGARCSADGTSPSLTSASHPNSTMASGGGLKFDMDDQKSYTEGLPLDVFASLADENGQLSAAVMERLAAAAAAEPYESVTYAFASYGSCVRDLQEGWTYRSRLWYGVCAPSKHDMFGGGGSGWEPWNSVIEKDANGCWIELPLIKKSVNMLQALLLDESGLGGGLGIGGGSGTGLGGMAALYQLLDSDQPFLCMLRMVLASMREDDIGDEGVLMRKMSFDDALFDGSDQQSGNLAVSDNIARVSTTRKPRSALLWSVLSPVLNMPISESKRQRVLVASCVLYSEVWHAIGKDRKILRKQYLETIMPPFVAMLRRWRPLLTGIHELATADGLNPLVFDDCALAADALPVEGALAMISPGWAAAFASPPAAMALAMIAAGASGGDGPTRASSTLIKQDMISFERKTAKLQTFSSFQISNKPPAALKDKASAKAAALAAARDLERNAKIGSGRGLSAVAMATSAQRRNASDMERVRRWSLSEAMGTAWMDCLQPVGSKSVYGKDFSALSYKFVAVLVASFALARNIRRSEIDRRTHVDMLAQHRLVTGNRSWRKLIHYLIEMKCLFGSFGDHLSHPERVFWKLDPQESYSRMRRCLRRNYQASACVVASANYDDVALKHDEQKVISASHAPVPAAAVVCVEALIEDDENAAVSNRFSDFGEEQYMENHSRQSSGDELLMQVSSESIEVPAANSLDIIEDSSVVALGYVPSESDERIILELPCTMVRPLRVARGTFQITTRKINFIVENMEDASSSNVLGQISETRDHEKNRSWSISSLYQIYSRRYLLRRSALELFLLDRHSYFFDFGTTEGRRNAFRAIIHACPPHLSNICLTPQRPDLLLKRTQLTECWARWEISNFEYLMHLNTLAGRSYNDITQYPIFPWILADYTSQNLDLCNPSSYRDLSKPVGALNPERLKKFQERYSNFDDTVIPKFHYDSHYSSAKTVLYYLVRVEPFTSLSIQLQARNVDHADTILSDVAATWIGVLEDMNDVKELVPEMFYLPEMLTNENSVDFGASQLGQKFDSVKIPPWAENPVDFIHKHRTALESEHVSSHLHEWIDLIFGYKQRGKEAISANNVFSYITYEGTVDIDRISEPVQQRVILDQIAYFGQTPSQLLTVPHRKRMPLAEVLHMQTIFKNPKGLKPYVVPTPEHCNLPASAMHASSDSVVIVDIHAPAAYVAEHKWQSHTPESQGPPFLFDHGKAAASSSGGALMRMFKSPSGTVSNNSNFSQALAFPTSRIRTSAVVAITSDKEIITGGHIDNSIRIISAEGAKTVETAIGHFAPVTCLALSSDSTYLVTGSRDTTVLLWRIHCIASNAYSADVSESAHGSDSSTSTSSNALATILADKSRRRRIEGPIHVLHGHLKEVLCCCVSSDIGIVVSCSQSADVLVHSIRRGRLIRRLAGVEADAVCLSSDGIIMAWNQSRHILSTYTLNGILVARVEFPFYGSISSMAVSYDGQTALVGVNLCSGKEESTEEHENCRLDIPSPSICFLDLYSLKVLHTLKLQDGQDIASMTLDKDNKRLLVSTMDRQLIVFADPALSSTTG